MTISWRRDALAGALSAGLALGVSELVAGLFGLPSMIEGLGNWVIDVVPKPLKELAISTFGTNDKLVLLISIAAVVIIVGGVVGIFAKQRLWLAVAVFAGFGVIAAFAAARDPRVTVAAAAIPAGIAVVAGLATLRAFYRIEAQPALSLETSDGASPPDRSRRSFLVGAGAVVGLAALAGGLGRALIEQGKRSASGRADVALPPAADPALPPPVGAELDVEGLSPLVTPNPDFYRIDTAFAVPRVGLEDWTLTVKGLVDRPYTISYYDLTDLRMVERYITLSCVSNEVGGNLVGNALWLGVPLTEVLDRAGVQADAEQVVGRSVDDFTVGFPVEAVYDGREALVAVGMNGEPLPQEHGFPARLVVAGLYGYVSATKWLSEIELTRWDDFDAYWIPRGWAKEAPIKTQSRIDTPVLANLAQGSHVVAGVAWAPNRGISRVEVELGEDADWVEAELAEPLGDNSWRQWRVVWDPPPGRYRVRVRATDGNGDTQTAEMRRPAPDGATGYHARTFLINEA